MLRPTLTLTVALVAALAGCADNFDEDLKAVQDAPYLSTGGTTGMAPTTGPGTSADGASASGDDDDGKTTGGAVGTTGANSSDITTSGDDTSGADGNSSGGGELPPPTIQDVDMPVKVALAGPVPFTATTMYTTSARALLDGVEIGALHDDGDGVFSGTVPIYGSVDNGDHVLEVIAARDDLSDDWLAQFTVTAPAPGTVAWAIGSTGQDTYVAAVCNRRHQRWLR